MTALAWDKEGERTYQAGLDRGVLYFCPEPGVSGGAVVWNGLVSVDETFNQEEKAYYQDGQKYLTYQIPSKFAAKLKAFTYPDEFEQMDGIYTKEGGLFVHDQPLKNFGLSYRTKLGDDLSGLERGYRLHLLYNLQAVSDDRAYSSVGNQLAAMEFSWSLTSIPVISGYGYRTTSHLSLKSTDLDPSTLAYLEGLLYGTANTAPYLPSLQELVSLIENPPAVSLDNNEVVASSSGSDVVLVDPNTYRISGADVIYLGSDTYQFTLNP